MDCRKWMERYSIDCRLRYSSLATQKNYISCVNTFLYYFKNEREPKEIPTQLIKEWLLTFGINTRNHKLCAIKSFYELTVNMPVKIDRIPYAKKSKSLPIVLSVDEIQKMFFVCENLKHKVILALLYSCGLRVSELIKLKWEHIDRSRMVINIIAAKGDKDRQVGLTQKIIPLLEQYYFEYKCKPFVLEGQFKEQYSSRSVLQVVKQLAEKAGLNKKVWTHLIRHCYGTHQVESGVDINLIQKILGHSNVKTTNIYLHTSHNLISKIQSPLCQIQL
jgi:integrase/recombinase XerD